MRTLAGNHASDLDDLVQLAAEQVFRDLPSFSGRSDVLTWVYSICYRTLLKQRRWYRRWSVRFSFQDEDVEHVSHEPSPHASFEEYESVKQLQVALARMSDKYRAVVVLCDLEELTIREVATIVASNELTVRSRLRDGRKQLKRLLEADAALTYGGSHELTPS